MTDKTPSRNGKPSGNLPVETPSQFAGLQHGNPGNKGGGNLTTAFRLRAAQKLEDAKGLDVMGNILAGGIPDVAPKDRIAAFRELRESAGYGAPKPVNIEATGDVKILVVYDE